MIRLEIKPRQTWSWDYFLKVSPPGSIALDGMVGEGPNYDTKTKHINFNHHEGCVREATFSTAKQVMFAIKGGLKPPCYTSKAEGLTSNAIYLNDPDQDTALAVWLLKHYYYFEGINSHPTINRLLELNDRLDVTGGAYPMSLSDSLIQQHNWIFEPYCLARKQGSLAIADEDSIRIILDSVLHRLDRFFVNQGELRELDTRHEILKNNNHYWIVNEIGGNDARYRLFSQGMNAYLSIVAQKVDGSFVYTIGRRSRYIDFPVPGIYKALNEIEEGWGGSDIIGGSPRAGGSRLTWQEISAIIDRVIQENK